MNIAVFRVMFLGLVRDRGALAMTFVVPAVFFLVFASIFAASSGGSFQPRVVVHSPSPDADVAGFVTELQATDAIRVTTILEGDETAARSLVRSGRADAGLLIRRAEGARPAFVILADPARDVAAQILRANVQRAFVVRYIAPAPLPGSDAFTIGPPIDVEPVTGAAAGANEVAYSAGAVALLFLLLSSVYGAVSLFEERDSGIVERIVAGPAGTRPLVDGKFLYLSLLGFVQIAVIFGIAWLVHGVDVPSQLLGWSLTSILSAAAAAGLALGLTSAFRTRQQALTFANVTMLIVSALGGSMIPRFLMPDFLQTIGWITPNAWALEAYTGLFWRDEVLTALTLPLTLLAAAAFAGLTIARSGARRLETV